MPTRILILLTLVAGLAAEMQTRELRYDLDGTTFVGTLTWSDALDAPRPLVVMVPNWMGPTPASLQKAQRVAGERYVVLMADVYGVDLRPSTSGQAAEAASALRADRPLLRRRAAKALAQALTLADELPIDRTRSAAIGFCFGGGTVLELARAGTDIDAVVSFHGNLDTPDATDAHDITAGVLVLHGADDPYVPQEQVQTFVSEMREAAVADWTLVQFGGAVHSFTDPEADNPGMSDYDQRTAERAFALMHAFLAERFADE